MMEGLPAWALLVSPAWTPLSAESWSFNSASWSCEPAAPPRVGLGRLRKHLCFHPLLDLALWLIRFSLVLAIGSQAASLMRVGGFWGRQLGDSSYGPDLLPSAFETSIPSLLTSFFSLTLSFLLSSAILFFPLFLRPSPYCSPLMILSLPVLMTPKLLLLPGFCFLPSPISELPQVNYIPRSPNKSI